MADRWQVLALQRPPETDVRIERSRFVYNERGLRHVTRWSRMKVSNV